MLNKYKIAVAGAAHIGHCSVGAKKASEQVGREIALQGCVLVTGATVGLPYWAAVGAKKAKGFSIGFSPAATEIAHKKVYRLPLDRFDIIVYTGFGYPGRNLLMTRSADGVIVICGRMGTLNEFTIAFEDEKPIGILEGQGGTADMIRQILKKGYRGTQKVIYDTEPKRLVKRLIKLIKKEKKKKRSLNKKF